MYERYRVVEEYMIMLPQNRPIIFSDRTLYDNVIIFLNRQCI